ncbi:MAG: AmmeMemoRadiSam system radical SAM enzyme [Patescibacteria group bacterium]
MQTAWLSKTLPSKKVQCLACNHYCQIPEGKTGICGVRRNEGGELQLLVYGKAASVATDPIEKKPLYHFFPGTAIFSLGTVGCNLRCQFCQNWDSSQFSKDHSEVEIESFGVDLMPEEIVAICLKEHIPAIAYTYNEPTVFFEYAHATMELAIQNKLRNVFVSNGFFSPELREHLPGLLDAANIDLKSFREDFYQQICGGRLAPVLDNIKFLHAHKIHLELTTLIIPGENDSTEELTQIAEFIASIDENIPWHISRYFPAYKFTNPPTPVKTLEHAAKIGKAAGLKHVHLGNV